MSAGNSARFRSPVKKQWLRVGEEPLWEFAARRVLAEFEFAKTIVTATPAEARIVRAISDYEVAEGGETREESLRNALTIVESEWVLVADAARALTPIEVIARVLAEKGAADSIAPALKVVDTIVTEDGEAADREKLRRVQTPQLSRAAALREALAAKSGFSDETTLIAAFGGKVKYVEGDELAGKLTYGGEIAPEAPSGAALIGQGFDAHAFEAGKPLRLCGVNVPSDFGLKAHSDGDAAIHALIDAILGAAGLGDIGTLFPDSDQTYKGIDSAELLARTVEMITRFGFKVLGADITIIAEKPHLEPHKTLMRKNLARLLALRYERVNVKATTTEKMGFTGRGEGIAAQAIAVLGYHN